jgi:hypothetical protein
MKAMRKAWRESARSHKEQRVIRRSERVQKVCAIIGSEDFR